MKLYNILFAGLMAGAASVSAASASTVGFELEGHVKARNFAKFSLTNTSSDAAIESMTMTIGKKKYNFDIVKSSTGIILKGDKKNGKKRFDEIALGFDEFASGDSAKFRLDLDKDKGRKRNKADYSKVLFNNGRAKNAMITVTFSNGEVVSTFLDDKNKRGLTRQLEGPMIRLASAEMLLDTVVMSDLSKVPLPAALPLMLGGLFGLGMVGRRRKA
jgi:hypothetical protein